jgi:predicted nuclease with TOPRIM domain
MPKEHFEVILEDIQGKFQLILEGHAALDRKFEVKIEELSEKVELNSFKIDVLSERVDRLETKVDHLETRFNRLEAKVDNLEVKVDGVAKALTAHRADTEAHPVVYRVKESLQEAWGERGRAAEKD